MKIILSKTLVFAVIVLFLLTGLSSVYAGFNVTSETIDTSVQIEIE